MLSYQHGYHAGNLADVHKHSLLAWALDYLTQKDKPLSYLETHAGRGLYDLQSAEALKTGEAAAGVTAILNAFPADHPYPRFVAEMRKDHGAQAYPGSPLIAAAALRPDDRLTFAEKHPQEFAALNDAISPYGAFCHQKDGPDLALSLCPPTPRRGVILIDPSYEVKDEYTQMPRLVAQLHRKWNVGVIMLWYPILKDGAHGPMRRALQAAVPEGFSHEVRFPPVRDGHRMVGSGLLVVNPPYGFDKAARFISTLFQDRLDRPM